MGRIYTDANDGPKAVEMFYKVLALTDSVDKASNYNLAYRTHSQLASIFEKQRIYSKSLEEDNKALDIAMRTCDTLATHATMEVIIRDYCGLEEHEQVIKVGEIYRQKMLEDGNIWQASIVHFDMLRAFIETGRLQEAKAAIDDFKRNSGYFNEDGTTIKGKHVFYYREGLYYMAIGKLDNAETSFRRLMDAADTNNDRECAYNGMLQVYCKRGDVDSIGLYTQLYNEAHDAAYKDLTSEMTATLSSVYDYDHSKRMADMKVKEAEFNEKLAKIVSMFVTIITLMVAGFAWYVWTSRRKAAEKERIILENEKNRLAKELKMEQKAVRQHKSVIQEQNARMKSYEKQEKQKRRDMARELEIEEALINDKLKVMGQADKGKAAREAAAGMALTERDKDDLLWYTERRHPRLAALMSKADMKDTNAIIAILLRLGFGEDEVKAITDIHGNSFTNRKSKINEMLFAQKSATTLAQNIRQF